MTTPTKEEVHAAVDTFTSIIADAMNEYMTLRIEQHNIEPLQALNETANMLEDAVMILFAKNMGSSILTLSLALMLESDSFSKRCLEFCKEEAKKLGIEGI